NGARIESSRQEDRREHHLDARMSVFLRAQDRQRNGRTESAMVACEDRERWGSLDQQYRRYLELRNARVWTTDARVRRGQIEWRHQRAPRPRRREISRA